MTARARWRIGLTDPSSALNVNHDTRDQAYAHAERVRAHVAAGTIQPQRITLLRRAGDEWQPREEGLETMTPKPTGTCTVCGRPYQLKTNGTLRSHWKRDGMGKGLPFSDPCDGAGQPPKEQQ